MTPVASAVEYGGIGGRPAHPRADNPRSQSIFIFQLKPGQTASDGVQIINNTSEQKTIAVYPVDSVLSSDGAFSCAQAAEAKQGVGKWISLAESSVTLEPNSNQVVPFTITAPTSASVGEHDGCIAIQDNSSDKTVAKTNGVNLSFRSAIRVAATIPGKIVKSLSLQKVETSRLDNGNFQVTPTAKNDGNVSLDTKFTTTLQSVFGGSTGQSQGTYPTLPHSSASWNFELKRPFWGGWYRANVAATYNSDTSASLGQKTANDSKTIQRTSAVFFVAPAPLAAVVEVLILLAIILVVWWLLRRRRHVVHVSRHWEMYKVKGKESLAAVASKHDTTWKQLARVNKLKPPYELTAGQEIKVPPKAKE
jgi:hypothetical protein